MLTNYIVDPANLFTYKSSNQNSLSYEQKMVDYLQEGYNITNLNPYDERIFNKLFIESQTENKEVIVLGSSRSQLINKNTIGCNNLINNSVTGATFEDIIALFNVYENKNIHVDKIILEISPWILNDNNEQSRWTVLEDEYNFFLRKLNASTKSKNKVYINPRYKELLSFEYFQESIKYLRHKNEIVDPFLFNNTSFNEEFPIDSLYSAVLKSDFSYQSKKNEPKIDYLNRILKQEDFYNKWISLFHDFELLEEDQNLINETIEVQKKGSGNSNLQENIIKRNRKLLEVTFWEYCPVSDEPSTFKTVNKNNNGLTRLTDGTLSYSENFKNRTQQQIDRSASTFANNIFGLSNFINISNTKTVLIKKFINYLTSKNIEVTILLLPYHPVVFEKIEKEYPIVLEAEKTIIKIAENNGIKHQGSYNPNKTKSTRSTFYDGMHLKLIEIEKIIKLK
tara:strand:+ start:2615 stop:3970 length:1356 start_codon:yes stop_codon:yes gene_type:complete